MVRQRSPQRDPAADAAALLRRLGFAILMIGLPVVALVTRRGVVVLAPIGVALLAIAAFIDGDHRGVSAGVASLFGRLAGIAGLVALGWAVLSLAWAPFSGPAGERLGNLAATLALGAAGYLALPTRMRSANLYPLAIGVGLAALAAIALLLVETRPAWDEETLTRDRGVVALALLVWPAAAWLHSRGRDLQSVAVVLAVAIATGLAPSALAFAGFATGAAVYLVAASQPRVAARLVGLGGGGLILAAPVLALALAPLEPGLAAWRGMILAEPIRLVTGYGFETALRGASVGLVPAGAPATFLFELWVDLGLVGAAALATAVAAAALGTTRIHAAVAPGALAALSAGLAMLVVGASYTQMWFVTSATVAALLFAAVERGQFRTQRPKAILGAILGRGKPGAE
ncbi:peptide ABC transporter permease [Salinarimonas chemoclinalis]|uniref:peptide ABC transporter permease n=1 Tax=Salinarimonas chemoclinalis TaxID=3241599 RepID=UPI0035584213